MRPLLPADETWLRPVGRALGGTATIRSREPLTGGYASGEVERVELDVDGRGVSVVVKPATPGETAALRAVSVVPGVDRPRVLAATREHLVVPHYAGGPVADGEPVPDAVWHVLGRVHAHWRGKRPRALPVVDGPWWRALVDRTLVAVRGGADRTGDPAYTDAERAVRAWREDERIHAALTLLPRTLVHGDPHRGNVLTGPDPVLIDWGNARVAPAGLDLAVLRAQGAEPPPAYPGPDPAPGEREWADVHVHVQYLGFAADHLGPARVAEMIAVATGALARLAPALRG